MNEVLFQVYVFFFILEMFMLVKRYVTATAPVMSNDVVFCHQQSKNKTYSLGGVEQSTTLVAGLSLCAFPSMADTKLNPNHCLFSLKFTFKSLDSI